MSLNFTDHQQVTELLRKNYSCLQRQYRLGFFEGYVSCVQRWLGPDEEDGFCELSAAAGAGGEPIEFRDAVDNFYKLIRHAEAKWPDVREGQKVLLLSGKSLVYEAKDYTVKVPAGLADDLVEVADRFLRSARPAEMERWAEELHGGPFEGEAAQDERTKVIKNLLIASLLGANHYYRQYDEAAYNHALTLLERIQDYVVKDLPQQHQVERESYGLLALTLFLKGRVLMAQGSYKRSREAFRLSAEAYVARVRQKEEFFRTGEIKSPEELYEKVSVTLRRAALVAAFGDGYLSFVTSEITRAREALTLARATLTHNVGRAYLAYVDLWFYACQRAAYSSDPKVLDEAIRGIDQCYQTFVSLVGDTHFVQRAGVQKALALYYRSKLSTRDSAEDSRMAMELLEDAINYASEFKGGKYKNPHLFADALVYKSYFLRARSRKAAPESALRSLEEARKVAQLACDVSKRLPSMESEAWAALGAVYTDIVEQRKNQRKDFFADFDNAMEALQRGLRKNAGENIRLDAAAYLRLARLCLLNPSTEILAYEYFQQWRTLEGQVEHAYLKQMARDLRRKDKIGGPFLLIRGDKSLKYKDWEQEVRAFLLDTAFRRFVAAHAREKHSDKEWNRLLFQYLRGTVEDQEKEVRALIKSKGLIDKLKKLLAAPPDDAPRPRLRSYTREGPKTSGEKSADGGSEAGGGEVEDR
ncbi:MAG: hypothetical protein JOZ02_00680 [Acidobacteria bacterium]|nr:hypothetical protein [Acidobacteriota bacterium]